MNPDIFEDSKLQFRVRKPPNWQFMPSAWSPTAQLKRAEDFKETLVRNAKLPFCCAMGHHESRAHAYPTLQVVARNAVPYTEGIGATLLESMIEAIRSVHPTFDLVETSSRSNLAGCRSIHLRGTFSIMISPDDRPIELVILSRSHVIFAPQATFTVGLSGSADPEYFDESEFDAILGSVCVGA